MVLEVIIKIVLFKTKKKQFQYVLSQNGRHDEKISAKSIEQSQQELKNLTREKFVFVVFAILI